MQNTRPDTFILFIAFFYRFLLSLSFILLSFYPFTLLPFYPLLKQTLLRAVSIYQDEICGHFIALLLFVDASILPFLSC